MASKSPFSLKRPPRSVMICGQKVTVRVVPYLEADGDDLLGAFNAESKTIFLLKGCDWKSVLLHEMIHGILYFSGAGEGLSASKEEQICISIEYALSNLIFC